MTVLAKVTTNTTIGVVASVVLLVGVLMSSGLLIGGAAVGLCVLGVRVFAPRLKKLRGKIPGKIQEGRAAEAESSANDPKIAFAQAEEEAVDAAGATSTEDLVEVMLRQGRYGLLLRPQIVDNLSPEQLEQAVEALEEGMSLVPEGTVLLQQPSDEPAGGQGDNVPQAFAVAVEPVFLDRYPVTNREFRRFVRSGGYEEVALWDQEILPGVLDFVDRTGHPGPRYWQNGNYPAEEDDLPVVGVCWYEAAAYARWTGKRLTSDPEWVKASSWPVPVSGGPPLQRKYPWGESMDRTLANLWGSGPGRIVAVTKFDGGVSVGGVYGLIGNVWEWTSSNFGRWHSSESRFEAPSTMKPLRGGAFDTYFDNHACCQFQSGDSPVARKHNIGFRCALGMCDVALSATSPAAEEPEQRVEDADVGEPVGVATYGAEQE